MLANKQPRSHHLLITYRGKYALWRLINILIIGVLAAGAVFTYCFIYQNIYNTISNTYAITELSSNINWTDLDTKDYEKTGIILGKKDDLKPTPNTIRYIFAYVSTSTVKTPTTTLTTSTTK